MKLNDVLKVKETELFFLKGQPGHPFRIECGTLYEKDVCSTETFGWQHVDNARILEWLIAEGVGRYPVISVAQKTELVAIMSMLDMTWLAKNTDGTIFAYASKPTKGFKVWSNTNKGHVRLYSCANVASLVFWEDEDPLYIPTLVRMYGDAAK